MYFYAGAYSEIGLVGGAKPGYGEGAKIFVLTNLGKTYYRNIYIW